MVGEEFLCSYLSISVQFGGWSGRTHDWLATERFLYYSYLLLIIIVTSQPASQLARKRGRKVVKKTFYLPIIAQEERLREEKFLVVVVVTEIKGRWGASPWDERACPSKLVP